MLLSLFCGAGGLDLGFEQAGFQVALALDRRSDAVKSYNANRTDNPAAKVQDLSSVTIERLDELHGGRLQPIGVVGGPPCQSFSQANVNQKPRDERTALPMSFARVVGGLNARAPVDFFVMENVVGLARQKHLPTLIAVEQHLDAAGFALARLLLNAKDHGTPQNRPRLFLVGINRNRFPKVQPSDWTVPIVSGGTVRSAISHLGPPTHFTRGATQAAEGLHPNHWCMAPKSQKFTQPGGVRPGVKGRSFKMLQWDAPSIAVAYGHREVNVHPTGSRRLSVYEAMLLQGFPPNFRLLGNLSSQIEQVSEAVPPPLAKAVASVVKANLYASAHDRAA